MAPNCRCEGRGTALWSEVRSGRCRDCAAPVSAAVAGDSWAISRRLHSRPQRNPPSVPSVRSTRWHGTNRAAALRAQADAAARTAAGRPDLAAYSV